MKGKSPHTLKKLGEYMVFPINTSRYTYDSQIAAEIRCREHLKNGASDFHRGAIVVKVVSVVTKDMVESE